ncbi:MAG TPA: serine protease [Thermoanaerobaculia bacterium]|nr:serine protease [Thermoanaerobaculia bacterium]
MERTKYDFPVRLLVFVAVSLFAVRMTAQSSGYDVAESLKANVVRIQAVSGDHTENGFGFIVGERGGSLYIATANHVVHPEDAGVDPVKVQVEFFDRQGAMIDATLLGTHDVTHDLAVLTVTPPSGFQWKKQCLGGAEQRKRSTEVWNIGKTRQWLVPVSPGRVASEEIIDGQMDLETMQILPGSSGGPLVASSGIVGIVLRDAADNATALDITYVKSYFKKWNHPWDLEAAGAAAPAPVGVAQAPPVAPAPAPVTQAPDTNPLHEGWYELYTRNGQAQRPGLVMRLRKVSEDYFLAETTTASEYGWSGELRRSGNAWDLKIGQLRGARQATAGTGLNPGNGSNQISKEGPLLTFKSELATLVWKETESRPVERPQPTSVAPAPSGGAQLLGALVGGLIASRTTASTDKETPHLRLRWRVATFPPPNAGTLAFTIMPDGNPACASYDQKTCLWGATVADLDLSKLKPLACGEMHRSVWGVTGYEDPKHWCRLAKMTAQ